MLLKRKTFSVLITGVGGQGVLHISRIMAEAASHQYPYVCRTESRGLSQRGGTISCEVRFGYRHVTPLLATGAEDLILSLDALETTRVAHCIHAEGSTISNQELTIPAYLTSLINECEKQHYEAQLKKKILTILTQNKCTIIDLKAVAQTEKCENLVNVIMLGAASAVLPLDPMQLRSSTIAAAPATHRDANTRAFDIGMHINTRIRTIDATLSSVA